MSSDPKAVEIFDAEAVNSKANRKLYAERIKVFPKRAYGTFRTLKWWVMAVTLGIYYIMPWLRWDRGEFAPNQAVLLDLANRRFYFFFIEIWPQEFYYVAGMLVMAGIGLFLITSTIGRAWCGYTCWQTVWVDLFLVVERFVEGDRNARMKLEKEPWNKTKIFKRFAKHALWVLISLATGGAWVFYFIDAPTLAYQLVTFTAPLGAYTVIAVLASLTYIFAGFMREQVCTYMCPWPRIQAAMLDEDSLTVTYNDWRGEPRNRKAKRAIAEGKLVGDCVDCNACVAVCPMGIDIRDGQQLECISCALCIDACNGVMQKLGMEHGLISYATLRDYNANMLVATDGTGKMEDINPVTMIDITAMAANKSKKVAAAAHYDQSRVDRLAHTSAKKIFRPRTLIYMGFLAVIAVSLLTVLATRSRLDINVLHDRNPVFVTLSDGSIRNGFKIKILNMIAKPRKFHVTVEGLPGVSITFSDSDRKYGNSFDVEVAPDKLRAMKIFLSMPRGSLKEMHTNFKFLVDEIDGEEHSYYNAKFEAPERAIRK